MTEAYDGRQVVGMDLHRRRSVLVRMTEDGRKLGTARITNSPAALRAVIARAGNHPGWSWTSKGIPLRRMQAPSASQWSWAKALFQTTSRSRAS